jgi:hypothetical protein
MTIGAFLDKQHTPTQDEIRAVLASAFSLWERLVQFIAESYGLRGELTYGGKKYGWNLWYRKSGKALASLYPQQGYFVAQVVLGRQQVEQAYQMPLAANVRSVLENTPQFHDGRWLFIKVISEEDVTDIQQLLMVKKRPRR